MQQLHATVQARRFWVEAFEKQGWVVDEDLCHTEAWERNEISAGNSLLYLVRRERTAPANPHRRPASSSSRAQRQSEPWPGAPSRQRAGALRG